MPGCTVCAAVVAYKYIEVPARRLIKTWFTGATARSEAALGKNQGLTGIGWASPTNNRDYTS